MEAKENDLPQKSDPAHFTAFYQPHCSSATIFHSQSLESRKATIFFYVWTADFRLNQLVDLATSIDTQIILYRYTVAYIWLQSIKI